MQKVKVHRYISGKRPEYAQRDASDESSAEEDFIENRRAIVIGKVRNVQEDDDQR